LFSAVVERGEPGKYWRLAQGCFWYLLRDRLDSFAGRFATWGTSVFLIFSGRFVFLGISVGLFVIVFVYVMQVLLLGKLICVLGATGVL
jgi:hypothetical protein